jgi:DNA-binding transcriptional regulator YhcF (GntR family)
LEEKKMRKSHRYGKLTFKVPNRLILDGSLSFSARRMGAVIYGHRNALGACRKSLARLAALASCSVSTARKALEELEKGKYITRYRNYRYNEKLNRMVYDKYTYHCDIRFDGGYTLIPRTLFGYELKNSTFALCLYLYLQAGNGTKAFPSLNETSKALWMAVSTVCRAFKALACAGVILAQFCIKANRAHAKNSYYFLCIPSVTASATQDAPLIVDGVSVLSLLFRASKRPGKRIGVVAAAPFPCQYYIAPNRRYQAISGVGGTFKISKHRLRLR